MSIIEHGIATFLAWSKGPVVIAGVLGGVVRWLTLRQHPFDGVLSIIVGGIMAAYMGEWTAHFINATFPFIPIEPASGGFVVGLCGMVLAGLVIDIMKGRALRISKSKENGSHDKS